MLGTKIFLGICKSKSSNQISLLNRLCNTYKNINGRVISVLYEGLVISRGT